jgi:hypothetical protein
MSNKKFKARLHTGIHEKTKETLWELRNEMGVDSLGDVIDNLVAEKRSQEKEEIVTDTFVELVSDAVVNKLKRQYLDPLRIRTGYADKQTKAIIEILNHVIVKNAWDGPKPFTTDVHMTTTVQEAQDKIQRDIEYFKQKKSSNAAKRTPEGEVDE